MKTEAVLAALNDEHKLNDSEVVDLLRSLDNVRSIDHIEELRNILEVISNENNDKSSAASKMLNTLNSRDIEFYEDYIDRVKSEGIHFISCIDDRYPEKLNSIACPPIALYVKGNLDAIYDGVAVVGTREANSHRKEFVDEIGKVLTNRGKTVVSGLAFGIDSAAHKAAIEHGGQTIAVLPGDINNVYPESNDPLAKQIVRNGALVSEVSEKVDIQRHRFVKRNRITSGLCDILVIGASGETGGTIHQANYATQQGREVLLYDRDDGQSPQKIKDMGARTFSDAAELENLLQNLEGSIELEYETTPNTSINYFL